MIIVSYDISSDKLRTKFSKFLEKFGYRLQYSVFQIRNSEKVLKNIETEIEHSFKKQFTETDSIIIFHLSAQCKRIHYGYARHEDSDFIIIE